MTNTVTLGDVEITRIPEWSGYFLPGTDFVAGSTPEDWIRHQPALAPDHWAPETGLTTIAMQLWALRSAGRLILVDTGVGNDKERPVMPVMHRRKSDLLDRLAAAGIEPQDVDVVVTTHIHADHVGWNTRLDGADWVPTFPNATYLMPEADYEFFRPGSTGPGPAMPELHANVFEDSVAPVFQAGQGELFGDSYQVDSHLTLSAVPGHTPGSSVLTLTSGRDRAVFVGDLVHSPMQILEPQLNSCFCEDPAVAAASRGRILGWAADNRALLFPAHLAGHGAAEVQRSEGTFVISGWAGFEVPERDPQ